MSFFLEKPNNLLSILILDFNRPEELKHTINSIKKHVKVSNEITVYGNGGNQNYHFELYNAGLIDRLFLSKDNCGAGYGCLNLFNLSRSKWSLYLEGDQLFLRDFTIEEFNFWTQTICMEGSQIKFINPVGMATNGEFSQRAFFCETLFYKEIIKDSEFGGPGKYSSRNTCENFVQNWLKNNNKYSIPVNNALVWDIGKYSLTEGEDGAVFCHMTDEKKVSLIKGPVLQRNNNIPFSEEQWAKIINTQKCENVIPEGWKNHIFKYWNF